MTYPRRNTQDARTDSGRQAGRFASDGSAFPCTTSSDFGFKYIVKSCPSGVSFGFSAVNSLS